MPASEQSRRARFHSLLLSKIRLLTDDSIALTFLVPQALRDEYRFLPGQYLTLRADIEGESLRRSYSIASASQQADRLEVGIRRVEGGRFSNWACGLSAGINMDVMTPQGNFTATIDVPPATQAHSAEQGVVDADSVTASVTDPASRAASEPSTGKQYLLIAAGSGITPCLSIIKSVLQAEKETRITLIYGNRNSNSIMFVDDLKALKDRYTDRFSIIHVLSRERTDSQLLKGRINSEKLQSFSDLKLISDKPWHSAYCCGPEAMLDEVVEWLLETKGLLPDQVHRELFMVAGSEQSKFKPAAASSVDRPSDTAAPKETDPDQVMVTIRIDGAERQVSVRGSSETILAAADRGGLELPFSCASGMCCACRCKVVAGSVNMDANYSLAKWEVEAGYVLACQSRHAEGDLILDFDQS